MTAAGLNDIDKNLVKVAGFSRLCGKMQSKKDCNVLLNRHHRRARDQQRPFSESIKYSINLRLKEIFISFFGNSICINCFHQVSRLFASIGIRQSVPESFDKSDER